MLKHFTLAFITILIFTITSASAQEKFDTRLLSKFSKKELKALDAETLNYWTFFLENSFEIVDVPEEKGSDADRQTVALKSLDKGDINVFKLGIRSHEFARDYYRIEGTGKMMIVLPLTEIDKNFKAQ